MKVLLDTANLEQIRGGVAIGRVSGITTNSTIISRENKPLARCIADIATIDPEPTILIEDVSDNTGELVSEAGKPVKLSPKVVIKLPMTPHGLAAAKDCHVSVYTLQEHWCSA